MVVIIREPRLDGHVGLTPVEMRVGDGSSGTRGRLNCEPKAAAMLVIVLLPSEI